MKRMMLRFGMMAGLIGAGAVEALAQVPAPVAGEEKVVYETVVPASKRVTFGEETIVKHRFRKTIIKDRPYRIVTPVPPVVRETRYFQPAPVVQQRVIQPPPVIERRVVQPPPVVEERVVQPEPIIENQVVQPAPVVESSVIRSEPVTRARYIPR